MQLEGAEQAVNLPDLLLHATEEADWDRAFAPAQAQRVEEALPLEGMVPWVREGILQRARQAGEASAAPAPRPPVVHGPVQAARHQQPQR